MAPQSALILPASTASARASSPSPAARTKLLLEGPVLPTLLRLAAPNVLNLLAFVGVITFDGFFLGRIGTNALAGASLAFPWVMLVLQTTNSGMGAGVSSAVARALGAGRRERADDLVFHAFLLALALAAVFSTAMLLASRIAGFFTAIATALPHPACCRRAPREGQRLAKLLAVARSRRLSSTKNAETLSMPKPEARLGRIAILSCGDEAARRSAAPATSRFKAIFAALDHVGVDAESVVYEDDALEAVRELATFKGVLVWVNPIHEGRSRARLDSLLREVAASGVWVSAHPDVILKMGTKEVLYRTRTMGWGCDTALYPSAEAMRIEFPPRLATGPRVIKRNRGNGGQGVWKVETLATLNSGPMVRVLDATKDASEELVLGEFLARCLEYFEDGCVIDQPFQARLSEGVVRCYMAGDRCAGFGQQKVKALVDSPATRADAGPRLYTSNADPRFQRLRRLMEDEWTPQLISLLDMAPRDLPMIWDADFMLGPKGADGMDSYVLGEINVSSVFPIPDEAPVEIAGRVADRLGQSGKSTSVGRMKRRRITRR